MAWSRPDYTHAAIGRSSAEFNQPQPLGDKLTHIMLAKEAVVTPLEFVLRLGTRWDRLVESQPVAISRLTHQMTQTISAQIGMEMRTPIARPATEAKSYCRRSPWSGDGAAPSRNSGNRTGLTLSMRPGLRRSTRNVETVTSAMGTSCKSDTSYLARSPQICLCALSS